MTNRSGSILYIPSVEVSILVRQAIGSGCKTVAVSGLIEQPRFHSPGRRLFGNLAGSSGFPSVVRRRMRRYCSTPGSQKCLFPFHFVAPLSCCGVQLRAFTMLPQRSICVNFPACRSSVGKQGRPRRPAWLGFVCLNPAHTSSSSVMKFVPHGPSMGPSVRRFSAAFTNTGHEL